MLSETVVECESSKVQVPISPISEERPATKLVIKIPRSSATSPNSSSEIIIRNLETNVDNDNLQTKQVRSLEKRPHWPVSPPIDNVQSQDEQQLANSIGTNKDSEINQRISQKQFSNTQGSLVEFPQKESDNTNFISHNIDQCKSGENTYTHIGHVIYEPFLQVNEKEHFRPGAIFSALIDSKYLKIDNPAAKQRFLWGGQDGIFTDDSDLACIVMNSGHKIEDNFDWGVKANFKVVERASEYESFTNNNIESRTWKNHSGLSIKLLSVQKQVYFNRKRPNPFKIKDGQSIIFSNKSFEPLLPFSELYWLSKLPKMIKSSFEKKPLIVIGHTYQYTLEKSDGKDKYVLFRGNDMLFEDVKWKEITWTSNGLSIRNTFLNLSGYRW